MENKRIVLNEKTIIESLENQGYTNIEILNIPEPHLLIGEHVHFEHTVHFMLEGRVTILDNYGQKTYKKGDRFEFQAGTRHNAISGPEGCKIIVGIKK